MTDLLEKMQELRTVAFMSDDMLMYEILDLAINCRLDMNDFVDANLAEIRELLAGEHAGAVVLPAPTTQTGKEKR